MTGNMQCFSYLQTVEKSFFDYLNYLNYLTTLTSACLLEGTPPDPPTSLLRNHFSMLDMTDGTYFTVYDICAYTVVVYDL
jgi:hypothetical protein